MAGLLVFGVDGLPEIGPGDDLAALVAGAAELVDGDVVVVTSKVVSKAEGAVVELATIDAVAVRHRLRRSAGTRTPGSSRSSCASRRGSCA